MVLQPMQEFYFAIILDFFLNLQNYINQWSMTKELQVIRDKFFCKMDTKLEFKGKSEVELIVL